MYDTTESDKRVNMPAPPDATPRRGLTDAERRRLEDDDQARVMAEWRERNGEGRGGWLGKVAKWLGSG